MKQMTILYLDQPIPENGSGTVNTVISNATPVLRRSSRVIKHLIV